MNSQILPDTEPNYLRSSLNVVLMETDNFPEREIILDAYFKSPFPDKYNNHKVGEKSFQPVQFQKQEIGKYNSSDTINMDRSVIEEYFAQRKIANHLVAKWFNRKPNGTFDVDLIVERGFYDATVLKEELAGKLARGLVILGDAGEELIKNTFVVVNKMNYISNEPSASDARDAAMAIAEEIDNILVRNSAIIAANRLYKKTKDGYLVETTSYLYQLEWNDSIAACFYEDLWVEGISPDISKVKAFDESTLFRLKFVGLDKANSLVLFSGKEKNTKEEIITLATIRNLEKVYARLQRNYDVFRTKTPIYSVNPIRAKIGMKEGLEGDEKFEVLEAVEDRNTGMVKYMFRDYIRVDKNEIWDNRFILEGANPEKGISSTAFKGGAKDIYPGMLIRQIK